MKDRIDKILVEMGFAITRSRAKQLVLEGVVYYQGQKVLKPQRLVETDGIEVLKSDQYVSRGAHKIEGAIRAFNIDILDKIVADVGASTGGFTDYLLRNGAKFVYAIDVGKAQLAKELLNDKRIKNIEGVNIKYPLQIDCLVDLCVVDLSYISLRLVIKNIVNLAHDGSDIILLVKPQFEAGKGNVPRDGVIKKDEQRINIIEELYDWLHMNNIFVKNAIRSPITGKNGNVEYFFYIKKDDLELFSREKLKEI